VVALTGGYRKTPFLQIGSDVYCDSALICDVLEHLAPTPTLYPAADKGLARIVAQWADEKLFWVAMAYNFAPKGTAQLFGGGNPDAPIEQWGPIAKSFGEDRGKMRVGMPRIPVADAAAAYKSYLRRIGLRAPKRRSWPAFWTPPLPYWPGWTAWQRSAMASLKKCLLQNQ
jgi:glutathione S-transferase